MCRKHGITASDDRLALPARKTTVVSLLRQLARVGRQPSSNRGQLCKPGWMHRWLCSLLACSRPEFTTCTAAHSASAPGFQLRYWNRCSRRSRSLSGESRLAVDQLDSARQPCWSKQTCIHVYECPAILRLLLHFALGVSMDIVAEALAGAAFITSAVSVGFALASGAFGTGTGFGAAGNLAYSFCRGGSHKKHVTLSAWTANTQPALKLDRWSADVQRSRACRNHGVSNHKAKSSRLPHPTFDPKPSTPKA